MLAETTAGGRPRSSGSIGGGESRKRRARVEFGVYQRLRMGLRRRNEAEEEAMEKSRWRRVVGGAAAAAAVVVVVVVNGGSGDEERQIEGWRRRR